MICEKREIILKYISLFPYNRTLSLCGDVYFLVTGGRVSATCQSPCIDTEKSKRGEGPHPSSAKII